MPTPKISQRRGIIYLCCLHTYLRCASVASSLRAVALKSLSTCAAVTEVKVSGPLFALQASHILDILHQCPCSQFVNVYRPRTCRALRDVHSVAISLRTSSNYILPHLVAREGGHELSMHIPNVQGALLQLMAVAVPVNPIQKGRAASAEIYSGVIHKNLALGDLPTTVGAAADHSIAVKLHTQLHQDQVCTVHGRPYPLVREIFNHCVNLPVGLYRQLVPCHVIIHLDRDTVMRRTVPWVFVVEACLEQSVLVVVRLAHAGRRPTRPWGVATRSTGCVYVS
jgi:hypothetical protein